MPHDLTSRLTALLNREKLSADKALEEAIANVHSDLAGKGTYRSSTNVWLTKKEYERDIQRRFEIVLATATKVLGISNQRQHKEAQDEITIIAEKWLTDHIATVQDKLLRHAERLRFGNRQPLNLESEVLLNALRAELAILFESPPTARLAQGSFVDPDRIEEMRRSGATPNDFGHLPPEEIKKLIAQGSSSSVEVVPHVPPENELLEVLAGLSLSGGGVLLLVPNERVGYFRGPEVEKLLAELKKIAEKLRIPTEINATLVDEKWIPHVQIQGSDNASAGYPQLSATQRDLLLELVRASKSGRYREEFLASHTFEPGWFVVLSGVKDQGDRELTGFEETDLLALREERYITLLRRGDQYRLSLKPKAFKEFTWAVESLRRTFPPNDQVRRSTARPLRDVFICHAGEDKEGVVEPLIAALDEAGITAWYDQREVRWGESLTNKINEGLRSSRFVLIVLSRAFLGKGWPERELNSALGREASSGGNRVLPLLVGHESEVRDIIAHYPLLEDKRRLGWTGASSPVVQELLRLLKDEGD